jgi:hypothetical protein
VTELILYTSFSVFGMPDTPSGLKNPHATRRNLFEYLNHLIETCESAFWLLKNQQFQKIQLHFSEASEDSSHAAISHHSRLEFLFCFSPDKMPA